MFKTLRDAWQIPELRKKLMFTLLMLLIIMDECGLAVSKRFLTGLLCINTCVLALALSPGHSTLYYRDVTLGYANGSSLLIKTYGPLHWVYLVFLLFYFGIMIAAIIAASRKRPKTPSKLATSLLLAVLLNILVWFIEQKIDLDFEFLSISYIVTELYLLSLYNMKGSFASSEEFFFTTEEENAESFKFMCVSDQQKGEPHDLPDYSYFTNVLKTVLSFSIVHL